MHPTDLLQLLYDKMPPRLYKHVNFSDICIKLLTFSNCSGSGVEISPEASFASKASMSRSFFLRFLSALEGSVAISAGNLFKFCCRASGELE